MHVAEVLAATGESDGALTYERLDAAKATPVRSTTAIKVRFDRFLLPASATRQALCLQANLKKVTAPEHCTEGVFLEPSYDPVRREAVYRQAPTNLPLSAGTKYKLTVFVPYAEGASGFRAFDGALLEDPPTFEFVVDDAGATPPAEAITQAELFCRNDKCTEGCMVITKPQVKECQDLCTDTACKTACIDACIARCPEHGVLDVLRECATNGCHGYADPNNRSEYPGPAMGLDLTDIEGLLRTAIRHPAHGSQTGEQARMPDESPRRFGRAMPLLDPGNAGNSYLLYKLLARGVPDAPDDLAEGEIDRLRASVVVGMPMPPANAQEKALLEAGQASQITTWLQQGAPVDDCGPTSARP